ncbi:MAG: hypothetical protein MPEBLZ_01675 [Candidatus Methanoperedens nitroreducens]|uniref:Uncharacterized protein n=1 Tax=Candidatus Methanoperedens nitratireducens TaxID=1392998 RepID=A0A0P8AH97_9EURY|nr:MAG: hypothetical protein MPEBLZ_01675 [Candidatus Methanoperedens sp. BLZ1]
MNILKKYLAPWAIPNENIPLNIVWNPNEEIQEIILIKPENLNIKEVFNSSYTIENDTTVKFKNFESNGYFSVELISKEIEKTEKKCDIVLEFKKDNISIEKINLSTKILRPKLELINVPENIKIIKFGDDFKVENPIRLKYKGAGEIYVQAKTSQSSELQIEIPAEISEVLIKFKSDFEMCLEELKPKYPQYEKLFVSLGNEIPSLDNIESELDVYSKIFENDMAFTKDFSEKLTWAITRNYAMLDDYIITPFIEFIRSAPIRAVRLMNPIWHVNFFKAPKFLNLKIEYYDSLNNIYEPLEISTKLSGDIEDTIDLFKLFEWETA